MERPTLSILIPARNEEFLGKTIENILQNIKGNTEVIAVLDGYTTPIPKLPNDNRVRVLYYSSSIGQRAATNVAARYSNATYVMKCDAHCAFDEGFDIKMTSLMQDNFVMVPTMYNLHAFDWVCTSPKCNNRKYQGPRTLCEKCGSIMDKEIIWKEKRNPKSNFYRFDTSMHFQYWGELGNRKEARFSGDLVDTLCIQGSCFLLTKEKYHQYNISDEKHGSWGQQGVEVALKFWTSGGRAITNTTTWYAHMFRTQADFSFPYPNPNIHQAREYSKDLWINNKWEGAKLTLNQVLDKFKPVPGWHTMSKGIVYYTDNSINPKILSSCKRRILGIAKEKDIKVAVVELNKRDIKEELADINIALNCERGILTMFRQILAGLEALESDIVFLCEHDVLYHPSHFDFIPYEDGVFYYNMNHWRLRMSDGLAVHFDHKAASGLCGFRKDLVSEYKLRVERVEKEGFNNGGFEPGTRSIRRGGFSDSKSAHWLSQYPNIDLRHDKNLTKSKWSPEEFKSQRSCKNWKETYVIDGWGDGNTKDIIAGII